MRCLALGFLGLIPLCALQIFLSLLIRSFAVPVGMDANGSSAVSASDFLLSCAVRTAVCSALTLSGDVR